MGAEVVKELVVVGETARVVRAKFFVFLRCDCLGKMMGVRVVIEVVVKVMLLFWWR